MKMKDDEPWRDDYLVFGAPALGAEEQAEVIACMQSGWVGSGPRVAEFERRLADYLAAPAVVAVNSCTAALHLALRVLDLPPGAEVITTAMTFCATANVIVHAGYEPVFADCDRATLNLDPYDVRQRLTPRTRARSMASPSSRTRHTPSRRPSTGGTAGRSGTSAVSASM